MIIMILKKEVKKKTKSRILRLVRTGSNIVRHSRSPRTLCLDELLTYRARGLHWGNTGLRSWQYGPSWASSVQKVAGFREQNHTALGRLRENGPHGEIQNKQGPIIMLGFTSRLLCCIINTNIFPRQLSYWNGMTISPTIQ